MKTREMFVMLNDKEIQQIDKLRLLMSMYDWKMKRLGKHGTEPFNAQMLNTAIEEMVAVLNIVARLDQTIVCLMESINRTTCEKSHSH